LQVRYRAGLVLFLHNMSPNLQVAKSVKTVLRAGQAIISVKLDMKRIDALQLDINSDTVAQAIVQTPKIKLKHVVSSALVCLTAHHNVCVPM
jgi:hypothetical protein